jgi:hypothetical protein
LVFVLEKKTREERKRKVESAPKSKFWRQAFRTVFFLLLLFFPFFLFPLSFSLSLSLSLSAYSVMLESAVRSYETHFHAFLNERWRLWNCNGHLWDSIAFSFSSLLFSSPSFLDFIS